jgi:hypothetical protein
MTFGKKRMILKTDSSVDEWELLRFCNKKHLSVVGGASRLFKKFKEDRNPKSVISYANRDISNGNLYKKIGFSLCAKTMPGYWWCIRGKKYHRSNFMKHKIAQTEEDKKLTEKEIMESRG